MKDWKYRPAADQMLAPGEQLRSVRREGGLASLVSRFGWGVLVKLYLAALHRCRVAGREHLPASPPFIIVANHASHLDALVLANALPWRLRRDVFPIAAGDTFFETPASAAFAALMLNALPMWRRHAGAHAMEQLRERLVAEACGYILFPEGTRTRTGELGRFKAGVGMLVAGSAVPVVPAYIRGAFEAWPPGAARPRLRRIDVRFGPALAFDGTPNTREGWHAVASALEERVFALAGRSAPAGETQETERGQR